MPPDCVEALDREKRILRLLDNSYARRLSFLYDSEVWMQPPGVLFVVSSEVFSPLFGLIVESKALSSSAHSSANFFKHLNFLRRLRLAGLSSLCSVRLFDTAGSR